MTVLAFTACSKNTALRREAIKILKSSDTTALVADAKSLWSSTNEKDFDIEPDKWPMTFASFSPVRVWRYHDGIYIITAKYVSHTAGIYIFIDPSATPADTSNVKYEHLMGSIFWVLTS